MNIKSVFAASALCMLPLTSLAGVVYEWTATNNEIPRGITLQLEFDRKTVKAGEFKLDLEYEYEADAKTVVPLRGLLNLRYTVPGNGSFMDYTSHRHTGFSFPSGRLMMDLAFIEGGYLSGKIFASDSNSRIELASADKTFTILDARSDEMMYNAGCQNYPSPCGGAIGFIQKVGEVPEPGSIALLTLGAAGLMSMRRRKFTSVQRVI